MVQVATQACAPPLVVRIDPRGALARRGDVVGVAPHGRVHVFGADGGRLESRVPCMVGRQAAELSHD